MTAGFIQWLARTGAITNRQVFKGRVQRYRDRASAGTEHKRTPYIVAELAAAFDSFLEFAFEYEAIDEQTKEELATRAWAALMRAATEQQKLQANQDPVVRFLEIADGALASGLAYLDDVNGDSEAPGGAHRIGWKYKGVVLLEPQVAFASVQKLSREQNEPIPMNQKTLWKRLKSRGLIARTDQGRNQLTWRSRRVICLVGDALPSAGVHLEEKGKAAFSF